MPFGLKNAGATFYWAMSFSFHDITHIVEAYINDLATHSRNWKDHYTHLCLVFGQCRHYKIHLNSNKCTISFESR